MFNFIIITTIIIIVIANERLKACLHTLLSMRLRHCGAFWLTNLRSNQVKLLTMYCNVVKALSKWDVEIQHKDLVTLDIFAHNIATLQ